MDPLDGTKDYIARRDTFSVIIGLAIKGIPTLGVVCVPARRKLYYAQLGQGAFEISHGKTRQITTSGITSLAASRMSVRIPTKEKRPLDAAIDNLEVKKRILGGSIGSRVCDVAANTADVFINTNHRAAKWDTLGGEIILTEAGGIIRNLKGEPLDYQQSKAHWSDLFVAASSKELANAALIALYT